ncbi:MAG TPA: hypothetical protein VK856_08935 [Anaerolineaceae bacterium]|nr:hypothetical protein [Anaerolineaceae bacterium]
MSYKLVKIVVVLLCALLSFSCVYIVVPDDIVMPDRKNASISSTWSGYATNIEFLDNDKIHIELSIHNDTNEWSKLESVPGKPALLTTGDKKVINCSNLIVSTGGHRLAPGFQMRGYAFGKKDSPEIQLLYVECEGVQDISGATLAISYDSYNGDLDDYSPDANKISGVIEINLDEIKTDLTYPVAVTIDDLIRQPDDSIVALSDNVVTLLGADRSENGFQFLWQNFNPSKFPLKTHIGTPPVIGENGIIYGVYETLDMVDVPITPPMENIEWTTEVTVPQDESGLYILLSVESKKPRTYVNYVIDISDQ